MFAEHYRRSIHRGRGTLKMEWSDCLLDCRLDRLRNLCRFCIESYKVCRVNLIDRRSSLIGKCSIDLQSRIFWIWTHRKYSIYYPRDSSSKCNGKPHKLLWHYYHRSAAGMRTNCCLKLVRWYHRLHIFAQCSHKLDRHRSTEGTVTLIHHQNSYPSKCTGSQNSTIDKHLHCKKHKRKGHYSWDNSKGIQYKFHSHQNMDLCRGIFLLLRAPS